MSHDLKRGDDLKLFGKTLPLDPTNVFSPNLSHKFRRSFCEKLSNNFSNTCEFFPYFLTKRSCCSECVIFNPPRPANKNFRPTVDFLSNIVTLKFLADNISAAINPEGPPPTIAI